MMTAVFDAADIISMLTGCMTTSMGRIYEHYQELSGMGPGSVYTHSLPALCDACKPILAKRFPAEAEWLKRSPITRDTVHAVIADFKEKFGDRFVIDTAETVAACASALKTNPFKGKPVIAVRVGGE